MKAVVLGWDALDVELIERFGLQGKFGMHQTKIDTYVNPHIGEPHTKELWPSMITGLHPDEHGIHAATEGDGVNWDSQTLRVAASVAEGVIPDDLKAYIGRKLREQGVGLETTESSYYAENGISTVFDEQGIGISIPNHQTPQDKAHGLDGSRDELWKELSVDKSLEVGMEPRVDHSTVNHLLGREYGKRLGQTISAIQDGEPLVWTWFGVLDTVGHIAPALGDDIVENWYHVAAKATQTIKEITDDDTIVVSVSDHGLQNGTHEHYATICSNAPGPCKQIDHVFDVADYLRSLDLSHGTAVSVDGEDVREVQDELEALGYV